MVGGLRVLNPDHFEEEPGLNPHWRPERATHQPSRKVLPKILNPEP